MDSRTAPAPSAFPAPAITADGYKIVAVYSPAGWAGAVAVAKSRGTFEALKGLGVQSLKAAGHTVVSLEALRAMAQIEPLFFCAERRAAKLSADGSAAFLTEEQLRACA